MRAQSFEFDFYYSAATDSAHIERHRRILSDALWARLNAILGRRPVTPRIENDTQWDVMSDYLERSATFLFILSGETAKNGWCLKELSSWLSKNQIERLFVIQITPAVKLSLPGVDRLTTYNLTTDLGFKSEDLDPCKPFFGSAPFYMAVDSLARDIVLALDATNNNTFMHQQASTQDGRKLRVFLSHASEDKPIVRELYNFLTTRGFDPWLDEVDLLPGQDWSAEIRRAVRASDVFLVCCSVKSCGKSGVFQREIRYALDIADELPEGKAFIIPVRFEECTVPDRLSRWQWVNLFDANGLEKLSRGLGIIVPRA